MLIVVVVFMFSVRLRISVVKVVVFVKFRVLISDVIEMLRYFLELLRRVGVIVLLSMGMKVKMVLVMMFGRVRGISIFCMICVGLLFRLW